MCVPSYTLQEARDAVDSRRPTLFEVEHVNSLTVSYPDLFYALPALRPTEPLVSGVCGSVNQCRARAAASYDWAVVLGLGMMVLSTHD